MVQSVVKKVEKDLENSEYKSNETKRDELFSHLFEACNILRGPINKDEFKEYVTPLLFFKRISDVYDEETQIALDASRGDEEFAAFKEECAELFGR